MSRAYTPGQRQEALDAYTNHGAAEAARRTGIPAGTIASWAHRAGIPAAVPDHMRAAVERGRLTAEERRQQLAEGLLADVERLRTQMFAPAVVHHFDRDGMLRTGHLDEPTFSDKRALATTLGILIDKVQLLTGQPTERLEQVDKIDREIEELLAQLGTDGQAPP